MSLPNPPPSPVENRLLAALPSEVKARLEPNLERVSLPFKEVLYESRELIKYIYFPINAVVSMLTIVEDRTLAEVGLVGNEGMVGLSVFLRIEATPFKAIVQVPGEGMRMKADVFNDLVNPDSPLYSLLLRYTHTLMFQISQSAACNSHHSVEQRCCRWLLMTCDRVPSNQFPLTQEFFSQMLGVRRASITVVAGRLQKAELIRYSRGQMTILDSPGLEAVSCQCYRLVKEEEDRLQT
ncbi:MULTISPECIES: Crp/Fnr family transcriptional regulator [unclassified Coleofasciculus]|uniref:Crp/Fnr family transcriptional regulator n=1 Tax=unclassified Coleofasciculus TaxID=2692782 RepID=UPI00188202F0|nr:MULTISPECIES: Crp/Fnr family transcriptional regulator [unclassified Coleofasciculus]MBE9125997.1 Crp/Fnr family transcriptional regulator [Coleofasciculus sp. LEGE 07081]MBE9149372.1 Crp/Fnr family transcriptional regulator [Coleofasciculus sp. LEGE 07092]